MIFSGVVFLYGFLPAVLLLYLIAGRQRGSGGIRLRNAVLLAASLFFYFWGEPVYVLLMIAVTAAAYGMGLWIDRVPAGAERKRVFTAAVLLALTPLLVFKYGAFLTENICRAAGIHARPLRLALPVGISFYTFQILSYLIDLYRGRVAVQKRPERFALYVMLFPQLVAGPIVRYAELEHALTDRESGMEQVSAGMERFMTGLAKKVLFANVLGELCTAWQQTADKSVLFAWMNLTAFTLQLYYDFSGYSDMAIGLGRMFGFSFPENFCYPFISRSITEFWRRWHMTLGGWFRDYVYIPLGGSRRGKRRLFFNLLVVWALTGLWHGAAWNFVLWGLYYGLLLAGEKLLWGDLLKRLPGIGARAVTLAAVLFGFLIFQSETAAEIPANFNALFAGKAVSMEAVYYLKSYAVLLIAGAVGATPLPKRLMQRIAQTKAGGVFTAAARPLFAAGLLILCTALLVDSSYNPFLYFRF